MNIHVLLSAIVICLITELQGSQFFTPSDTGLINGENKSDQEGMCWAVGCLVQYAKFYNEILLHNDNFRFGYLQYGSYTYAVSYFKMWDNTRISSIRKAFETCIQYNRLTPEQCENFFNAFSKRYYTIDLIPDYCVQHADICENPEQLLTVDCMDNLSLQTIETLQFSNCLSDMTERNYQILQDNLRFGHLLRTEFQRNRLSKNRCSCKQVHMLANTYRVFIQGADITELWAPLEFDDLLTAVCISTAEEYTQFLLPEDIVNDITTEIRIFGETIKDPVELVKQILLQELVIGGVISNVELGWTAKYIVSKVVAFSVEPKYYKVAVGVISLAITGLHKAVVFETFLKATDQMYTKIVNTLPLGYNMRPMWIQWVQKLFLRKLFFMTFHDGKRIQSWDLINKCTLDQSPLFDDMLIFYMNFYHVN